MAKRGKGGGTNNSGFEFKGFADFVNDMEVLEARFDEFLQEFMWGVLLDAYELVVPLTPVDTGVLRSAWKMDGVTFDGHTLVATFSNDMNYASYVEYGHAWPYWGGIAGPGDPQWVDGFFMATIAKDKAIAMMPKRFDRMFKLFLRRIERQ